MEEKQLYAVDRLEQAKRVILLAKEEIPAARRKIEKQLQRDPNGAKDCTKTLRNLQARPPVTVIKPPNRHWLLYRTRKSHALHLSSAGFQIRELPR